VAPAQQAGCFNEGAGFEQLEGGHKSSQTNDCMKKTQEIQNDVLESPPFAGRPDPHVSSNTKHRDHRPR
jgi:hypothetical protein